MSTYYFPINSLSLAHYFGCACIKAAKYFDNKPKDLQDSYKDFLLLTQKKGTKATDCCLELVLTEEEISDLIDAQNGWRLLDTKPLPITRIKKIFFADKEQMDTTITNIRMSTAYVPEFLLDVCTFDENPVETQVPNDCVGVDQTDKINQYDRFLGALAMMRLAREPYMNYSQNYIATLSFFNQLIEKQLRTNGKNAFSDAFQGLFKKNNGFEKVLRYLENLIDEESLNSVACENNQTIKKDKITRIVDIDSLTDTWTYTIAILNAYGVGDESRKMRIDGLIQSNFNTLREGKQEGIALCYGYNRGYSAFTKSYGEVAFKYKLDSQLDYYTIESVYQYVFNEKVSSGFPYLDSWCPKFQHNLPKRSTEYVILDELIVGKKKAKVFSQDWWNGFSQKFEKAFGVLSKPILEFVKSIIEKEVYADIKEELQESFQDELNKKDSLCRKIQEELDETHKKLEESNETIRQLQKELKTTNLNKTYQNREQSAYKGAVAEPTIIDGQNEDLNESLKRAALRYKDATLEELKKNVKKATYKSKLGEILLNQPRDLFSK